MTGTLAGAPAAAVVVSVELVVLAVRPDGLRVLVRAGDQDVELPGTPLEPSASLDDTRDLLLTDHAGVLGDVDLVDQLGSVGPHARPGAPAAVTVGYLVLAHAPDDLDPAGPLRWAPVHAVPPGPARSVVDLAVERAGALLEHTTVAAALCGTAFTVAQLRRVYEAVWARRVDPRNFHRKVTGVADFVVATGGQVRDGGRPAALYRRGNAETLHPPMRRESG